MKKKRAEQAAQILEVVLIVDIDSIEKMKITELKDQLEKHCIEYKDQEILLKKDLPRKKELQDVLIAAIGRYLIQCSEADNNIQSGRMEDIGPDTSHL